MKTKTICDHPLLIGEVLRRADARAKRRTFWRRVFGLERAPRTRVYRISENEVIYSPNR